MEEISVNLKKGILNYYGRKNKKYPASDKEVYTFFNTIFYI